MGNSVPEDPSPAEFSSNSNQTHLNKRHVFRIESYRWVFISVGAKLCMKGPLGPSRAWMTKGTGPKESFIWGARLACFGCSLCFYITNVTKKAIRTDYSGVSRCFCSSGAKLRVETVSALRYPHRRKNAPENQTRKSHHSLWQLFGSSCFKI